MANARAAYLRTLVLAALLGVPVAFGPVLFQIAVHDVNHVVWEDVLDWFGWSEPAALYVILVPALAGLLVALAMRSRTTEGIPRSKAQRRSHQATGPRQHPARRPCGRRLLRRQGGRLRIPECRDQSPLAGDRPRRLPRRRTPDGRGDGRILGRTTGLAAAEDVQVMGYDDSYWELIHDLEPATTGQANEPALARAGDGDAEAVDVTITPAGPWGPAGGPR